MNRLAAIVLVLTAAILPAPPASADSFLDALRSGLGGRPAAPEFLDPDVAFVVAAGSGTDGGLTTRWRVAEGYYLYSQKIGVQSLDPGVSVAPVSAPVTEVKDDPYFGQVPIVVGEFEIPLTVTGAAPGTRVALQVNYQGCAEAGICYPPIKKLLDVFVSEAEAAPAVAAPTAVAPTAAAPTLVATGLSTAVPVAQSADALSEKLRSGTLIATLGLFFVVGLGLALTPCVLPMIPILSGIIVGQGPGLSARRGLSLSLVYVVAMALTYAGAGVIAGLFGKNLQAAFQAPAVLIGFAAVFVLLALSMFGLYDLQLPASVQTRLTEWSNRQRGGALGGVALMGALSAIIVGPCVAPPLAGALLYIAQSGDAWLGGAALFVLALGMGAPLLAIGASAGHWLPRAGAWMEAVKHAFGFILLGVALWLLERILPASVVLAAWGVLLICAAVAIGALEALPATSTGMQRLWKGLGLVLLTWGAAALIGAAAGGERLSRPLGILAARAEAGPEHLAFRPIKGLAGLERALAESRAQARPVMLDFYADWCIECRQMERTTFADAAVRDALAPIMLIQANVTPNDAEDQALMRRYELFGPPAILFFDTNGREIRSARLIGYLDATRFRAHLAQFDGFQVAAQ